MYAVEFTIREPKKPWINLIIFALAFSGFFTFVLYLFLDKDFFSEASVSTAILLLWVFWFLISLLIPIVARHHIQFNFSNLKIRHRYTIGSFAYNESWQDLKRLKYISVFHTSNGFEINMWYQKNKILNLAALEDGEEAMKKGLLFSEKLNIDLLDARKKGDHKWVDKVNFRKTGSVSYL